MKKVDYCNIKILILNNYQTLICQCKLNVHLNSVAINEVI